MVDTPVSYDSMNQTVGYQAAVGRTWAFPEQWQWQEAAKLVPTEGSGVSIAATDMPSEFASSSSRGASEAAEMPEGQFEDESEDPASPSKSARRRMRRRRQRDTLKASTPLGACVPPCGFGARLPTEMRTASAPFHRSSVTLGDLGFALAAPFDDRCGTTSASAMAAATTPLAAGSRGPMPPGRRVPPQSFTVGEPQGFWASFASPCRAHLERQGTNASVVGHLGLDTIGTLEVPGSSSTTSTTTSDCSEVSFCPLTATAQLWMPIKPSRCHIASPSNATDAGVMGTGVSPSKTGASGDASSRIPCHAIGDASSRIPCMAAQGGAVCAPLAESLASQALGCHSFGAPEVNAFGGTDHRTQLGTADALQLLLGGGVQPKYELEAQLRAAAPEVYED